MFTGSDDLQEEERWRKHAWAVSPQGSIHQEASIDIYACNGVKVESLNKIDRTDAWTCHGRWTDHARRSCKERSRGTWSH